MKNRKPILTLIGFVLFLSGFLSIALMMVGAQFKFLTFLDFAGRLWGFVARLIMIMTGAVLIYLTQSNWQEEDAWNG